MKKPRMIVTLVVALLLALLISAIKPELLAVTLYKLSLLAVAAVGGYYLDRECFPYARPDALLALHRTEPGKGWYFLVAAAMLRRAFVVGAAIIAVGLGA